MEINRRQIDEDELNSLLESQEDQFLDFKSKRIKPGKLQDHYVAFANTDGGELYIGIEDASSTTDRVQGFPSIEDANEHINVLISNTNPTVANVDIEILEEPNGTFILHFNVPKSEKVHYTNANECFIRQNASSRRITGQQIVDLEHSKGTRSYERSLVNDYDVPSLVSSEHLLTYLTKIKTKLDPIPFLNKQRLIRKDHGDDKSTVAGVLLFDEEPQASLPTRCAIKVYRLLTSDTDYNRDQLATDPKTIEGPLEEQINNVMAWVEAALKGATFNVGGELQKLRYPPETLKEILVNAVIHRDYSLNDDVHVRIYDDRIEVRSPGRLPGYITPQNILAERYSRNPTIVRMLHKLPNPPNKDIGEGIKTAFNGMRKAGLTSPVIEELENYVVVTIKHQPLASLEDLIMGHLEENEFVSNKIIRDLSGEKSENKVKNAFRRLRDAKKIEPEDPDAPAFKFRYRKVTSQSILFEDSE